MTSDFNFSKKKISGDFSNLLSENDCHLGALVVAGSKSVQLLMIICSNEEYNIIQELYSEEKVSLQIQLLLNTREDEMVDLITTIRKKV